MRNIFLFIRRFSFFIVFVLLQILSLYLLFSYNKFHKAKSLDAAQQITGFFNKKYNTLENFFQMKQENRRVHAMNDSLMNLLKDNFVKTYADAVGIVDVDALENGTRHYLWREAQVLYTTVHTDKNYLQINRGASSGIAEDMGVFSSDGGLVGKVVNVGKNFSQVMTLLHVMNKLSVQMKKNGAPGMLSWDGENFNELTLTGVHKTDSIRLGDTVLTGTYSLSYPPQKMVGTINRILKNDATNFLILKVKPAANFGSLQQVFVVENLDMDEQKNLDKQTKEKIDKKTGK
jgi:rod shape-determining protein MreC